MFCLGNGSANVHLSGVDGGGEGRLVCPDNLGAKLCEGVKILLLYFSPNADVHNKSTPDNRKKTVNPTTGH